MSKNSQTQYRVGTGASVMLLIFMVMSLATLGILSLMSARSDREMSMRSARYAQGYYQAQDSAQRRMAQLAQDIRGMDAQALAAYARDNGLDFADGRLRFSVDASYDRQLDIVLAVEEDGLRLVSSALVNTGDWDTGLLDLGF